MFFFSSAKTKLCVKISAQLYETKMFFSYLLGGGKGGINLIGVSVR